MSGAGRAAGRPDRFFAAALRFARTTGHTGIDVSAGGGRSAPRKKGANTMCGRYQFSWEESRMLARIREAVRKAGAQAPRDEVFPSDGAPVLVLREGKVVPAVMGWGFPGMQGGRNVINARAETAEERPMFRDGVAARRCVVPATGFYEWDADKRRYLFRMPARTELYMAALYGVFGGEARYCILTTQANASVAPVHHRMPLVLRAQEVRPWLEDEQTARRLLHETPPELERRETDGQLRLW